MNTIWIGPKLTLSHLFSIDKNTMHITMNNLYMMVKRLDPWQTTGHSVQNFCEPEPRIENVIESERMDAFQSSHVSHTDAVCSNVYIPNIFSGNISNGPISCKIMRKTFWI